MNESLKIFQCLSEDSKNIFSLIQKKGPLTKNKLLLMTKIKLTSLNRFMQPLEEQGLVVEVGTGASTGGRKPVLYDVNPSRFYLVGLDISRTYTQVIITNLKMEILDRRRFLMQECFTPVKTVKTISTTLKEMLKALLIDTSMLLGVGLGTIGPLDRAEGVILNPKNFPAKGWHHTWIKRFLEQELALPVMIDNGANTAAVAELLFGSGRNLSNIAYFNCGIGIRTGVISSGTIVRTINDAEDAFGHMVIDVDGEQCSCGNYGCIERYSSIPSIVQKYGSAVKKGRFSAVSKPLQEINYMDICDAAEQKAELAREIITDAAAIFGAGLANYMNLLNPDLIVLSGPLIKHSPLFYQVCTRIALKKYYLKEEGKVIFSRGGHFKDSAIAVGAAAMVIESYLNSTVLG
ncbi:MAG: ROK family protein [Firmicutes bacterium]|nr:ROK family protein [Bacillota bacterium]